MATPKTGGIGNNGDPTVTLTRKCAHCERDREVENLQNPDTFPCARCGAISAWLCHLCGQRTPGTLRMTDGRQACASCRQAVTHGHRA